MVTLKKKTLKGKAYYYLEHSMRKGKKVQKKEIYLGRKIPANIDKIKKNFLAALELHLSVLKEKATETISI